MTFIKLHKNSRDISGQRFGRLVAKGAIRHDRDKSGRKLIVWLCQCDCGNETETRSCNLLSGDTTSCGCLSKDVLIARNTTHGNAKRGKQSHEYLCWARMVQRCEQPTSTNYAYYGGRGISVCERWRTFENFLADMGEAPSKQHSPDRLDSNGNYEPQNVRWATRREQMANTRRNRHITAFGETLHMQEWCRRYGILQGTLWDRLDRGWSPEDAISKPVTK